LRVYITKRQSLNARSLSTGHGMILNQLRNFYNKWYMKRAWSSTLERRMMKLHEGKDDDNVK